MTHRPARRTFLKAVAAAAASGALPASIATALALPANRRTGTLADVEHVVILMQENRAFDHYYGTLRGVRGFGDPRPLMLRNGRSVFHQPAPDGHGPDGTGTVLPFHLDGQISNAQGLKSLDHSWKGAFADWAEYDVWIKHKTAQAMGHFVRADIPYYHALADAFTIADQYFCSLHGPTNPNRMFLFTGTSGLSVGDDRAQAVDNVDDGNWTADMARDKADFPAVSRWTTYAERLQAAGISWQVYQEYENYGDNSLAYFAQFRGLERTSPLYRRGRAFIEGTSLQTAATSQAQYLVSAFAKDVAADTLPQVSWIVAPYKYCEHPEATPAYGESLTARLVEALVANPKVWAKTALIINYDENDGFFDHVPGPVPAVSRQQGLTSVEPRGEIYKGEPVGLGIRVPLLVVSPWTRGGFVHSGVADHTSVIRFLERRFGVMEPNISSWRRAVTGDLTDVFDFADPDAAALHAMPAIGDYRARVAAQASMPQPRPPQAQALPQQEPGQRPARALPYRLAVREAGEGADWQLVFANTGRQGAVFQVYDRAGSAGPWTYTVAAGATLRDRPPGLGEGPCRLIVRGPNGFVRELAGPLPPPARVGLEEAGDQVVLTLANPGTAPLALTVRRLAYGPRELARLTLAAGQTRTLRVPVAASHHWYDLVVDGPAGFRRRYAGHVETGKPSWSDPAIGTLVEA
ncbi:MULTISPECIES: phospholipase C, phosphocholine-specific [unclassified Novosphingobium]|uniref:phosphocholine-specific phospholipase C n=1 Tax=unclassified Novosphingobium TaxID=2644732 RepID=UPI00146E53E0|nr:MULTISPECIES: phospholipase C, phosphocholine-specific [unclassified Novosphingobium]NMN05188.1 phospholipase C [Novosphingobium sp. SG919]NMN87483.1 phospholipase C [Novosphingobium sp. SG916]